MLINLLAYTPGSFAVKFCNFATQEYSLSIKAIIPEKLG